MAETGYQYDRRGQEQMAGFQYDKDLHDMNVDFTKLQDTLQRNRINIQAGADVWVAGEKAGISIHQTGEEEAIRLKAKQKGYDYMAKSLGALWGKDSAKGEEITVNSYVNSITGLGKLQEIEDKVLQNLNLIERDIAGAEKGTDTSSLKKTRSIYQNRLQDVNAYREGLNSHTNVYKQMGVTPKGVMPQEKQAYIFQGLAAMKKMNLPIDQMSGEELLGGLSKMLPEMEITQDDMDFILSNALAFMKKIAK